MDSKRGRAGDWMVGCDLSREGWEVACFWGGEGIGSVMGCDRGRGMVWKMSASCKAC